MIGKILKVSGSNHFSEKFLSATIGKPCLFETAGIYEGNDVMIWITDAGKKVEEIGAVQRPVIRVKDNIISIDGFIYDDEHRTIRMCFEIQI